MQTILKFVTITFVVGFTTCTGTFCAAQENDIVRFIRIMAPISRIADLLRDGDEPYIGFSKKTFDEIVEISRSNNPKRNIPLHFDTISLRGVLRDASALEGDGTLRVRSTKKTIPLKQLGFWLTNARLANDEQITIGSAGLFPFLEFPDSENKDVSDDSTGTPQVENIRNVRFQWSMNGRKDTSNNIMFDIQTPPCTDIRLELDIPSQWVPHCPDAVISRVVDQESTSDSPGIQGSSPQKTSRKWKISLGGRNRSVLTLSQESTASQIRDMGAIRQSLSYNLGAAGLDLKSEVPFEKPFDSATSLIVELDDPLRVVSIKYAGIPIQWTEIPESSDAGIRKLIVSIPQSEGRLIINACCPITLNESWKLPGIKLRSSRHYWSETKTELLVNDPLLVSDLYTNDACQIVPQQILRTQGWNGKEYAFQHYDSNSSVSVELTLQSSKLFWKSGTVVDWEDDRITASVSYDFTSIQSKSHLVEMVCQPGWTLDMNSIESFPKGEILFWEGTNTSANERVSLLPYELLKNDSIVDPLPKYLQNADSEKNDAITASQAKSLFVYMKRPTKLRLTGYRSPPQTGSLLATDLLPVRLKNTESLGYNSGTAIGGMQSEIGFGKHLIAFGTQSSNRLKPIPPHGQVPRQLTASDPLIRECFTESNLPVGYDIFVFDPGFRMVRVKLDRMKISYDSNITCNLTLHGKNLLQKYRFNCTPRGNRIDRIIVHFSQDSSVPWTWSLGNEPNQLLAVRELSADERIGIACPPGGSVWEIILPIPRSGAFELVAQRELVVEKQIAIPFAVLPESVANQVEIEIDSPYESGIDIVNMRLKSIPISAPPINEYPTVRAAFRYDPSNHEDTLEQPSLILRPGANERIAPFAWVWVLKLDSIFETNGIVRQHATFFIENRGQKQIEITLPGNVQSDDILAVWIGNKKTTWTQFDSNGETENSDEPQRIFLTLPEKQRFVSVMLEYLCIEKPLVYRKKVRPVFPKMDLPVLSETWIAWTPSGFQTFLRGRPEGLIVSENDRKGDFRLIPELSLTSNLPGNAAFTKPFDPLSVESWQGVLSFDKRREHCKAVAEKLVETLGNDLKINSYRKQVSDAAKSTTDSDVTRQTEDSNQLTWGNVFGNFDFLADVFGNSPNIGVPRIKVDWIALRRIGVFPTTPIALSNMATPRISGHATLEQAGISVLFYDERSVLITSALNAAKYQRGLESLVGDRVKIMRSGPLAEKFRDSFVTNQPPQWISFSTWNNRATGQSYPWQNTFSSTRIATVTSGWSAIELRKTDAQGGIYVAYGPAMVALCWFAFVSVVILSRSKRFSNMPVLVVMVFFFGILAKLLSPYYAVIPSGACFGALCGLGFVLVRRQPSKRELSKKSLLDRQTQVFDDSSEAVYEVKELRPFKNNRPVQSKSFFDSLQEDSDGSSSNATTDPFIPAEKPAIP